MTIGLPAIGLLTLGVEWGVPHLVRRAQERELNSRCLARRCLVLSYDDGPGEGLTPDLLDVLRTAGAPATFFLLGRRAAGNERIIARARADAHELACHGQDHLNAWKVWPWRATADVRRGYETLTHWVPRDGLYRPPHGKMVFPTLWVIRRRRARIAWWTIDSGDTHPQLPRPQSVADRVARAGGGVVLMHDFDRGLDRARFVLDTTQLLLETALREDLTICRYSDLWTSAPRPRG
jgi:peptidoglycan/xylan/chitin deacetylase (PgdA/CDA1 family)